MRSLSLSLRRAWIEIALHIILGQLIFVSLSLRRAWIEIILFVLSLFGNYVALLTESVD